MLLLLLLPLPLPLENKVTVKLLGLMSDDGWWRQHSSLLHSIFDLWLDNRPWMSSLTFLFNPMHTRSCTHVCLIFIYYSIDKTKLKKIYSLSSTTYSRHLFTVGPCLGHIDNWQEAEWFDLWFGCGLGELLLLLLGVDSNSIVTLTLEWLERELERDKR